MGDGQGDWPIVKSDREAETPVFASLWDFNWDRDPA